MRSISPRLWAAKNNARSKGCRRQRHHGYLRNVDTMKLSDEPPLHLTYCLNVHPGETWEENFAAIRETTLRVRNQVGSPDDDFGLGLRLSRRAAMTLAATDRLVEFHEFCDANRLYVFTINGFPYGRFHGHPVKADVYRPDWRRRERLDYTNVLTDILAALLPNGVNGSISTVPGAYKTELDSSMDGRQQIVEHLVAAAAHAADTLTRTGQSITIALEPEPDCLLGTVDETIAFFRGTLMEFGIPWLQRTRGLNSAEAAKLLARHIGVCFDTTHMAVEFEDLVAGLERLREAKVPISKIHLGAALSVGEGANAATVLREFREPVYLHQTRRQKAGGAIAGFRDLPDALAAPAVCGERWRVHFHVPLFFDQSGDLCSTRELLTPRFFRLLSCGITEHLEIETYTYDVLPQALAVNDVAEGIAREYRWVLRKMKENPE